MSASEKITPAALAGIRVLDLGTLFAGPMTATLLGEFGADVIKFEQPGVGEPLRGWSSGHKGHSAIWAQEGRNKRSVTCDLRQPEGQDLVRRLVAQSDIVVENYRPGTLERWQLGYEALCAVKPDIIMVRVTGYGQTGPNAKKPGFARVAQAYSGLIHMTGEPGGAPLTPGSPTLSDYITPVFAAFGAMMALRHRDKTGEGQVVDMALYEATFRILDTLTVDYASSGTIRGPAGRAGAPYAAPHGQFRCKDGSWVAIACTGDRMWQRFCKAVGRDELAIDDRYATVMARVERRTELEELVDGMTAAYTREELLALLDAEGVVAGPVNSIEDIFQDPHYWAREMLVKVTDPLYGELVMPGIVPKLSRTPGRIDHLGPSKAGEHNDAVYGELLGLTRDELAALQAKKVI